MFELSDTLDLMLILESDGLILLELMFLHLGRSDLVLI